VVEGCVKLKEENIRLASVRRIKKLCKKTLLSLDNIFPLANYYQVANNCMVYPIAVTAVITAISILRCTNNTAFSPGIHSTMM